MEMFEGASRNGIDQNAALRLFYARFKAGGTTELQGMMPFDATICRQRGGIENGYSQFFLLSLFDCHNRYHG
jgi:hypothetical protein